MIRKTLFILISGLLLTACNTPEKEKQETTDNAPETKIATTDAITGASSEPAIILNISKEEGLTKVSDFLKDCHPYYLATVENNIPAVRPIGIALNYDGKLWFHIGEQKASSRQIKNNPHIEIASLNSKGQCMRIFGKAVIMENDSVDKIVFEKYPNLKEMYNTEHKQKLGHFYISEGLANLPTDSGTVIIKF